MIPDSLRPVLNVAAGLVVGFLVAWGLFERLSTKSGGASVLPAPVSSAASSPQLAPSSSPRRADEDVVTEANPSATVSPSPSATGQQNGLPLGVTRGALNYNKELYQKYPGLKPPLINTDGRDLGPEARRQFEGPPNMLPNVSASPAVSVKPFMLVVPNKPSDQSASPFSTQVLAAWGHGPLTRRAV
jgi:hypothetical protein